MTNIVTWSIKIGRDEKSRDTVLLNITTLCCLLLIADLSCLNNLKNKKNLFFVSCYFVSKHYLKACDPWFFQKCYASQKRCKDLIFVQKFNKYLFKFFFKGLPSGFKL